MENEKKQFVKWLVILIALIVISVITAILVFNYMPTEKSSETVTNTPEEQRAVMRLNTTRAAANGSDCTLTATVEPADATVKDVTWSIAWKNASSSWASGKNVNDYVTLASDGMTATVTNNAAFGEQAVITVRSDSNPDVYASCTVDYAKRLSLPHGGGYMDIVRKGNAAQRFTDISFGTGMYIGTDIPYSSTGTVYGNVEFTNLTLSLDSSIRSYIQQNVTGSGSRYAFKDLTYEFSNGSAGVTLQSPLDFFTVMDSSVSSSLKSAFIAACRNGGRVRFGSSFTYKYGSTVISSGSALGEFSVNTIGLETAVTGVKVDNPSLVF